MDPAQQAALEQLLRTIAERAVQMDTKDIIALTAVFNAACSGMGGGGGAGSGAAAVSALGQQLSGQAERHSWGDDGSAANGGGGDVPSGPLPKLSDVIGSLQSVKVSARTDVKKIAGALSNILRSSDTLAATAVGPEGVNHVMKALSITRCYVAAEGIDLTASVTEVEPEAGINSGRCYAFVIYKIMVQPKEGGPLCAAGVGRTEPQPRSMRPPDLQTELRVSGSGMAGPVAGAVAKALREDKEVIITSVGPASVAKSVEAIALARNYVRANGIELCFYPGFETIIFQGSGPGAGEQRSSVRIHAWPEPSA